MENEMPPLSLEEMNERMGEIEDKAWLAESRSAALKFIVANLLIELDKRSVIDGPAFIALLETAVPQLETPAQMSVTEIFEQLRKYVGEGVPDGHVLH